jgi:predicted Zn-dependent protease with MMP-like domain
VRGPTPSLRRILLPALAALVAGLGLVSLIAGFSDSSGIRLLQGIAVFGLGAVVLGGAVALALVQLAGWRDPESESEFEELVRRSERLAAAGSWGEGDEDLDDYAYDDSDDDLIDVRDEEDFRALVRSAVDELPLEFHRALEHVAVVVSDSGAGAIRRRGRTRGAYGLYQGDTVARDYFHDRIIIFRDTLLRDFGHDPDLLREQVKRTVRHELAHHLGWDENGVRGLGL